MKIEQASPVVLSSDMERTADWFRTALGWECELVGDPPNFGIASRDGVRIMFALTTQPITPNWRLVENIWNVYIRVDDVDAWHADLVGPGSRARLRPLRPALGDARVRSAGPGRP